MNFRIVTILALSGALCASCGTVKRGTVPWEDDPDSPPVGRSPNPPSVSTPTVATFADSGDSQEGHEIKKSLELAYKDWKGVPYILGGSGYNGVDCSAFMQIVFEDYFSRMLPRNTREQLQVGKTVRKHQIKTGDLVFFKTGRRTFHVGVMVNKEEFLHASTTAGVMISGLEEAYWEESYYTARRIL